MRNLVLILLFMAVPLAGGELKPSQESDFWKDTGVDLDFTKRMISTSECGTSAFHFHACRKALIEGAHAAGLDRDRRLSVLRRLKFKRDFDFGPLLQIIADAKSEKPQEMILGRVINGYMHSLDPYAKLMPASFVESLYSSESKTYFSLGFETSPTALGISIFQVYPNTPASKAGLRMHDRIVAVNGIHMRDEIEADLMMRDLHGNAGTTFILEVERAGRRSTIEVASAPMSYPDSVVEIQKVGGKNLAYYRIRSFASDTCLHLQQQLEKWENGGVKLSGLVLDLRHNLGGYVEEGKCVAQLFVGDRNIVSREAVKLEFPASLKIERSKSLDTIDSYQWRRTFDALPLVVLIDERSASASEIVAGALQDHERAWVVGERSYGKGTTQLIHRLENYPKLRVVKTVSRYIRPKGLAVQSVGVTPNIEASFSALANAKERTFTREENLQKTVRMESQPSWQETRMEKVLAIKKCLGKQKHSGEVDFQLATAFDIFSCEP